MCNLNNSTQLCDCKPSIGVDLSTANGGLSPPGATVGGEGLVPYQQSLGGCSDGGPVRVLPGPRGRVVLSPEALERVERRKLERRARVARLRRVDRAAKSYGKAKRYRVVVECEDETKTIDSVDARISRCQRRVHAWADALPHGNRRIRRRNETVGIGPRAVMVTLTYANADDWAPGQIREFMIGIRASLEDNLIGYAWVLEMQKRGAPHYHVLLYVKRGARIERPDDRLWKYGSSRIETARSLFYICTYTGKKYQKEGLPCGARMFAVQIYVGVLSDEDLIEFRMSAVPAWLKKELMARFKEFGASLRWSRNDGGGWIMHNTGEILVSPWIVRAVELVD